MVQFNPLQGLGVASQLQQMDEMRLRQQEAKAQRDAQAQQQARLQELIPLVQQGDYNASIELATINPQMATAIEQAKSRMSEGQDKATADWIIGYHTAPDKEAYLSQDNPSIDIDDQFRTMPLEQREVLTKIVGAQVMPQQTFEAAFSSAKGPDFQYKDGLVFNPATGDVERTEYYQEPGGGAVEYTNLRTDDKGVTTGYNKATGRIEVVPTQEGVNRGAATPQTVVNLGGEGLTEEQKALAKQRVNRYGKITEAAEAATQEIDSINQIRSIDLDTGFGTELKANAARVIDALGGDGEAIAGVNVDDVDKFNSVAERQVLNIMATQKGPQTDQDAARIKKTVAGTETTKEANAFILDSMEAISNRKIEQQEFWDSYLEDNDGSLKGVQSAWNKYKKATPMVSEVVKNPATGKPMFYYQFRESFRDRGYPDDEIIESWRKLTGGK